MDPTLSIAEDEAAAHKSALYLTKPYAFRPKVPTESPPGRKQFIQLGMSVGGERAGYNNETHKLFLGGNDYDVYEWLELRHRFDSMFERDGQLERVAPAKGEYDGQSSQFLTRNWRPIIKQKSGTWKQPPWWLKWLYSAVITKETHG